MDFVRATKKQKKLRLGLLGTAGCGKTFTALGIAQHFGKIAVLDSENESASLYSDDFEFAAPPLRPEKFNVNLAADFLKSCERNGIDTAILDSFSAFWYAEGGLLQLADTTARAKYRGNTHAAWADVTPEYNRLIDLIKFAKVHVICTLRTKSEWDVEKDDKGKTKPVKVGTAPVMRADTDYEFDITAILNKENHMSIDKTRCRFVKGKIYQPTKIVTNADLKLVGKEFADDVKGWLNSGEAIAEEARAVPSFDPELAKMIRAKYDTLIMGAESIEALRAFLPAMKADYPKLIDSDVAVLKTAYTAKSDALKSAGANGATT